LPPRAFTAPASTPSLPNFDKRAKQNQAERKLTPPQAEALEKLRARIPELRLELHPAFKHAETFVFACRRSCRAKREERNGAIQQGRAPRRADAHGPTRDFLDEHAALFGYGSAALDRARLKREAVTPHNGLRTSVWEQRVDDIAVYEGVFVSHQSAGGALVSLSSQFVTEPERAADVGTPNRAAVQQAPPLGARQAVALATEALEEPVGVDDIESLQGLPEDAEQRQRFKAGTLPGEARARLVWLPLGPYQLRLCWRWN
jgi:hypothetical protein